MDVSPHLEWPRREPEHPLDLSLVAEPALSSGIAPYRNQVIEADNIHALRFLYPSLKSRVKCILIDPPYNTGSKSMTYNDRQGLADWLSFIHARLALAVDMLTDDGIILVCIDDANRPYIDMLLGDLMPGRRVGAFAWRCRSGSNDAKAPYLSMDHEHVIAYANPGFRFRSELPLSTIILRPGEQAADPGVTHIRSGMTQEGTRLLGSIMGSKVFDFPKPLSLIQGLIERCTSSDGNDIVLDFFGGSGTTAHAVLALNAADGGDRRFIIVCNTEATPKNPHKNICRDICAERIRRVIAGYPTFKAGKTLRVAGLGGDFAYARIEVSTLD